MLTAPAVCHGNLFPLLLSFADFPCRMKWAVVFLFAYLLQFNVNSFVGELDREGLLICHAKLLRH